LSVISSLISVMKVGMFSGFLFGCLIGWAMFSSFRKMQDPPSRIAQVVSILAVICFTSIIIGPMFSFVYRHLFIRMFHAKAFLLYAGLNTLVLGIFMNIYAWWRRFKDLSLIVFLNIGGAIVLGWLIPILYALLKIK